jgi:hypothetical protein
MYHTEPVGEIKTHLVCSITSSENRAVYEIMWKNTGQTMRMRTACWIIKDTDKQSEYVMIYGIFVDCNWVVTRWQQYSTHLQTNYT